MLVFISSLAVFLASIVLAGAVKALPPAELKRQARAGKKGQAASIYKLVSYGSSLDIFLGLLVISSFIGSVLAAAEISWWLVVGVFIVSLLVWLKDPNGKTNKVSWSLAGYLAYPADWILTILNPIFRRLAMVSRRPRPVRRHTGAYDKEDLIEYFNDQSRQADNRIDETDLQTARLALTFGEKTVGGAMTPKRKVKFVAAGDSIGPHLMDELHASGFSEFPVQKGPAKTPDSQIIGVLHLLDLVSHPDTGKVKDLARSEVCYINEAQTLREALGVFLKVHQHLLIVVNNFEEVVGVLSLNDVVKQLFAEVPDDEFENYDSLRAVAGREAGKSAVAGDEVVPDKSEVIE